MEPLIRPPDPAENPLPQLDLNQLLTPPPSLPGAPMTQPGADGANPWAAVLVMAAVLGAAVVMLVAGSGVSEAVLLSGGVMLLGVATARRVVGAGGLLPTIATAVVVAGFALTLLVRDYPFSEVSLISGGAGLFAGEVTAWVLRISTPRRGV